MVCIRGVGVHPNSVVGLEDYLQVRACGAVC